jgi:hypothetical protein
VLGNSLFLDLYQVRSHSVLGTVNGDRSLTLGIQCVLELGHLLGLESNDSCLDVPGIFLELHSEGLSIETRLELLVDVRLGQGLLDDKLLLGLVGVYSQVVSRSVGTTNTLDPSVRGLNLEIPTVL